MNMRGFWVISKKAYYYYTIFTILFLGIFISLYLDEKLYYLTSLVLFLSLTIVLIFLFFRKNITNTVFLLIGILITFNIEVSLISTYREGGLPSSIVINQYLIHSLILLFLLMTLKKKPLVNKLYKYLLFMLVMMLLITFVSTIFSKNIVGALYQLERHIFTLIIYISIVGILSIKNYKYFIYGLSVSIFLQFIISIVQNYTGQSLGLQFLGENPDPFRKGVIESERGVSGTLGHPGTLGLFLSFSYPILLTYIIESYLRKEIKNALFFLMIIISIIVLTILTSARTSMFLIAFSTMCVSGFYYIRFLKKHRLRNSNLIFHYIIVLFIPTLFILLTTIFLINQEQRFLESDFIRQFHDRMNMNYFSWNIITKSFKNFFIGVGPNNYVDYLGMFGNGEFLYEHPVHNYYLLIFAENGVLYLILYLLFFIILLNKLVKMIFSLKSSYPHIYIGTASSFFVMLSYNLTGWSFSHNQIYYLIFIQVSIVVRLLIEEDKGIGT
jgi:hypothetical protein